MGVSEFCLLCQLTPLSPPVTFHHSIFILCSQLHLTQDCGDPIINTLHTSFVNSTIQTNHQPHLSLFPYQSYSCLSLSFFISFFSFYLSVFSSSLSVCLVRSLTFFSTSLHLTDLSHLSVCQSFLSPQLLSSLSCPCLIFLSSCLFCVG